MDLIAAISGLTTGINLLQTAAGLALDNAVATKINEAQIAVSSALSDLLRAQQQVFEQQKEIEKLHQQVKAHDDWKTVEARYRMLSTAGGATVYESVESTQKHYACPVCFAKKAILPLQTSDGGYFYNCPSCNNALYQLREPPPIEVRHHRGGWESS